MRKTNLIPRARELRRNLTPQERKPRYLFQRPHPIHFRRQQPFGHFIVDFYCPITVGRKSKTTPSIPTRIVGVVFIDS